MKVKPIIFCLLLFSILYTSCGNQAQSDLNLSNVIGHYRFSIAAWECKALVNEIRGTIDYKKTPIEDINVVIQYFNNKDDPSLRKTAERIIEKQIRIILEEQNIRNPFWNFAGLRFPPVNFKLDQPPCLLVVSPREKIERIKDVLLLPNLTSDEREKIESVIAEQGFSALVVDLGGLGATFPTFVNQDSDLKSVIDAATEEWLHQYLTFTPLGFRYVLDLLGIHRDYNVVTINESLASMVSSEISSLVYEKYYSDILPQKKPATDTNNSTDSFDFNKEMRSIRITVDSLLEQGEIEKAEQYMQGKRDYLETKGYYIRKLNQAYFAFYGSYADDPASVSPVGEMLKNLRAKSPSVREFLTKVSRVTSMETLQELQ